MKIVTKEDENSGLYKSYQRELKEHPAGARMLALIAFVALFVASLSIFYWALS